MTSVQDCTDKRTTVNELQCAIFADHPLQLRNDNTIGLLHEKIAVEHFNVRTKRVVSPTQGFQSNTQVEIRHRPETPQHMICESQRFRHIYAWQKYKATTTNHLMVKSSKKQNLCRALRSALHWSTWTFIPLTTSSEPATSIHRPSPASRE